MSIKGNTDSSNQEGRIVLALSAYCQRQFRNLRRAATVFKVPATTLTTGFHGIGYRPENRFIHLKLPATEEETIVQSPLDLDSRGFSPQPCDVVDMAH
ncbi:hypothetical protein K3495_g4208 [Podosphaera aphanis]|nr:hypothetical protein K3495_g4208 [Podosphaera aphanis]